MTDYDGVIKSDGNISTRGAAFITAGGALNTNDGNIDAGAGGVTAGGGVDATGGTVDASALGSTIPYVTVGNTPPTTYQTPLVQDTTAITGGVYAWDGAAYQKISTV